MSEKPLATTQSPDDAHADAGRRESGRPGGGHGRTDVTGFPDGVRIDPGLTEGHPGYEESGDSEIIPAKPPAKG
jgi:hypothetical protein